MTGFTLKPSATVLEPRVHHLPARTPRTRKSLARHYLSTPQLTEAEISYLLGYDDTNSFSTAPSTPGPAEPRNTPAPRPDQAVSSGESAK